MRVPAAVGTVVKPSGGEALLFSYLKALFMNAKSFSTLALALAVVISTPLYAANGPGANRNVSSSLSPVEATDLTFMRNEEGRLG
jgi:hypothetical protein